MSKLTKIGGIVLLLTLLASLIVGAVPTSAATLGWSDVKTPGTQGSVIIQGSNVDALAIAPDNMTMFAFDSTAFLLYKSTNGGKTWTTTGIGGTLEAAAVAVVAMAVSPDYASDKTVVAVTATGVYRSINGGETFGAVGTAPGLPVALGLAGTAVITSVDIANHYMGGQAILIGIADPAATFGGVYRYTTGDLAWVDLNATATKTVTTVAVALGDPTITTSAAAGTFPATGTIIVGTQSVTYTAFAAGVFTLTVAATQVHAVGTQVGFKGVDALAVKFSKNHQADAGYLAVITEDVTSFDTWTTYKFGGDAWGTGILDARILNGAAATDCPTNASMALPADYEWSSNNYVFVGTRGATTGNANDAWRIQGALPGGTSRATDMEIAGNNTTTNVFSVAFKGNAVDGTLVVGQAASNTIRRTTDALASSPSWKSSTKNPTGAANFIVAIAGDNICAGSNGVGSAFSASTDGGVTFNQMALIRVSNTTWVLATAAALTIADFKAVDANTMYLILADAAASESLFKTTDGGNSWQRIWYQEGLAMIELSPNYATDNTIYVAQNDTRLWRSTNGGTTFVGLTAPANITAMAAVDNTTYYTAGANSFYKSGRWTNATLFGGNAVSVVLASDGIFVGTSVGDVLISTDDGANFSRVGAQNALGAANAVTVALSNAYDTNKTLFASAGAGGLFRFVRGTDTVWLNIDANNPTDVVLAPTGALYATSGNAGIGVRRSVSPSGPTAGARNFQSMNKDYAAASIFKGGLNIVEGSNVAYGIVDTDPLLAAVASTYGTFGYIDRVQTFSDTVTAQVTVTAPANNAVTPNSGTVNFAWTAVTSPYQLTYSLQVATDTGFNNQIGGSPFATTGTAWTVTGLTPGTVYYWRVRVNLVDGAGLVSPWSASRNFTPELARPGLQAPQPGEMYASVLPAFQWGAVNGAASYELYLADNPFFYEPQVRTPLYHNVYQWNVELEKGTTYYWRVFAVAGTNKSQAGEGVFTVNDDPNIVAAEKMAAVPPVTIPPQTQQPAPVVNVPQPTVIIPAQAPAQQISPPFIWAIIIIGAILVIAVIVLIVRTRRVS